ncbi:MAG: heme-binding protein [Pseudomonas sp.]|uniref:GlcG/HbpS family heme-binding protein n=1 Tax=Pseudomonas sp. TaxID=306 RepID=UPI0039821437
MRELLRQQTTLTLELAMHALQAALQAAENEHLKISIAIVDAAGQLVHMAHMDNAPLHSRDIARNKALTALAFGVPTGSWQQRLANCSTAVQQGLPLQANMALFGGGEPFHAAGQVIGAIGISGASEQLDCLCAEAARAKVERLLSAQVKNPGSQEQDDKPIPSP